MMAFGRVHLLYLLTVTVAFVSLVFLIPLYILKWVKGSSPSLYGGEHDTTGGETVSKERAYDGGAHSSAADEIAVYPHERKLPSAPPISPPPATLGLQPPPTYNEAVASVNGPDGRAHRESPAGRTTISGPNDLEWHQVFNAFNEKRMAAATRWVPLPASERLLKKRLKHVEDFLNAPTHPVSAQAIYRFLKSFDLLTNLVYAGSLSAARRIDVSSDTAVDDDDDGGETKRGVGTYDVTGGHAAAAYREMFLNSFRLLVSRYVPREPVTDRAVPFGYDWFIFTGRMTYAVINAHVTLCTAADREEAHTARPYYSENALVDTRTVVKGLKNICQNFTESMGYERVSSNRVFIATAFLYASLLEKACDSLAPVAVRTTTPGGLLPDYMETLNGILNDPSNRYESVRTLIGEIGKSHVPRVGGKRSAEATTSARVPAGAERGDVTYDGVYDERSFIAHRRLRMYSYIHPYCEQLLSVQLLVREKWLDQKRLAALLNAVEPMSDEGALFYFNLHSRKGVFKYRNGSSLFAVLGISRFRHGDRTPTSSSSYYGRVYVADRARILFVQSDAFTFHTIGQLSDLAYGEVEKANRDLMPAWLMGQRPLFRSEKNALTDVPCGAHLEPCVIDTGRSKDLQLNPIKRRNTTDYVPTEASSALVVFEEQNIGAVFTSVREANMDVYYSRCTVATPYYTFTTYFRIARNSRDAGGDQETVRLSCYTGSADWAAGTDRSDRSGVDDSGAALLRPFVFEHCTVRVFVQKRDGTPYRGRSVALIGPERVDRREKSKSKYTSAELQNVSLTLSPYGHRGPRPLHASALASITVLYRPRADFETVPPSLANRKISPRVTAARRDDDDVYRIQVDSRYVVYCDTAREVLVLLDTDERRACIAPVRSTLQDDIDPPTDNGALIERASLTIGDEKNTLGTMKYDTSCNYRVYAYFQDV